ncbi:MAG: FtsX-like permease family protein, partial [Candidatus Aminicenantes bacterium]|nr:FtsX-like permease family protein [Candidatus Aminicenantes bacterium]
VGMRKTVGAQKIDIIRQFFSESMLLTVISSLFGIIIVVLFLPVFNSLTGKHFTIEFLSKMSTVFGIAGIIFITGIIAGSYPALFLSHFQPIKVLKGAISTGMKSTLFRKILVVTQFSLSIFLILGTIIIYSQLNYMRNRELGFDKENIIYTSIGSGFRQNIGSIITEMRRNPNILNLTLTNIAPYRWNTNAGVGDVHWKGKTNQAVKMVVTSVDYDYLETFKLKIVQGRFFSREFSTDISDAYVINEAAVKAMEMDSPVGKELRIWDLSGKIIGVVKDYHFESLHREIIPMAMRILPNWFAHVCIRIDPNNIPAALSFIEEKWKEISPGYPFEYSFLDDAIISQYHSEKDVGRIFKYFTFLAIFISCLGLFGLALYTTEQRTKEIGIRKVLGASVPSLTLLLSKEFIKWVLLANVIAWPAAWYIMSKWLQSFAYKTNIGLLTFVLSGILALSISMITVSFQTIKVAIANPVESLRYE